MNFLIKSDTACWKDFPPQPLVRGRADVLLDFALEALRAGATRVYIAFCDDVVVEIERSSAKNSKELARELLGAKRFKASLKEVVASWRGPVYYLHESGIDIDRVEIPKDALIVVGDQDGLSREDEEFLRGRAVWVSIGPLPYLSWFCAPYVIKRARR
ncbi:MAG: RNA methyltransferase [Thermoproteus sp.]